MSELEVTVSNGTFRTKCPRPCACSIPASFRWAFTPRPCSFPTLFMSVSPCRTRNRSCDEVELEQGLEVEAPQLELGLLHPAPPSWTSGCGDGGTVPETAPAAGRFRGLLAFAVVVFVLVVLSALEVSARHAFLVVVVGHEEEDREEGGVGGGHHLLASFRLRVSNVDVFVVSKMVVLLSPPPSPLLLLLVLLLSLLQLGFTGG